MATNILLNLSFIVGKYFGFLRTYRLWQIQKLYNNLYFYICQEIIPNIKDLFVLTGKLGNIYDENKRYVCSGKDLLWVLRIALVGTTGVFHFDWYIWLLAKLKDKLIYGLNIFLYYGANKKIKKNVHLLSVCASRNSSLFLHTICAQMTLILGRGVDGWIVSQKLTLTNQGMGGTQITEFELMLFLDSPLLTTDKNK